MSRLLEIEQLCFTYPEQTAQAVKALTLTVERGDFLMLCGPSGCGKTTLLRQLKPALTPHGQRTGTILFDGAPLEALDAPAQAAKIGFVQQSPEDQVVTDKVWHELAFGLESLGTDTPTIRRRVAEMASFFGMEPWFYRDVAELSGGQKQLLNLAAVMTLQPELLILDEPTSQLDPIAASEFLSVLGRINRELGVTVLLTEQRLEEALPLATAAAVLDGGRLVCTGTPAEVGAALRKAGHGMFAAMPAAMRVWAASETEDAPCPVTVREGRSWLEGFAARHPLQELPPAPIPVCSGETVLTADGLWFRYGQNLPDTVRGLNLTLHRGEMLAVLGGNGTGKTTTLKLLGGLLRPQRGSVRLSGPASVLPQNPQTLFVKKTVREDLAEGLPKEQREQDMTYMARLCRLEGLLDRHPYDLSGGEQQRLALAKVLSRRPDILLLDEPTKGLDADFKRTLGEIMGTLLRRGVGILMVSHDVEFCAEYAHRCALFFDGSIVAEGTPRAFFSGNSFYTTSANRMARALAPEAVTVEDVINLCGGTTPPPPELPEDDEPLPPPEVQSTSWKPKKLPWWRKAAAALAGATVLAAFLQITGVTDLSTIITAGGMASGGQLPLYGTLIAALAVLAAALGRRSPPPISAQTPAEKRKLSGRTRLAAVLILLLIPLTLFAGVTYLGNRKYYIISLLILLETMLPFFLVFEGRKPQPRELVLIALLCAMGVAGRAAFSMLPQFKPVMALTILTGVAFGGETGFLVGSVTMLASNILFSQGPWTPWQMFCMGVIGFLAGVLFQKGALLRSRGAMSIFGAFAAIVIYGGIINPASALMWSHEINWKILLTYYVTGFPMDCVQAAATAAFLWFAGEPMLEKLERIKTKYGLVG